MPDKHAMTDMQSSKGELSAQHSVNTVDGLCRLVAMIRLSSVVVCMLQTTTEHKLIMATMQILTKLLLHSRTLSPILPEHTGRPHSTCYYAGHKTSSLA